jgi:hypothetical protein
MADVQCGTFDYMGQSPYTGNVQFRSRLTPAPDRGWIAVFQEYQRSERELGNTAVATIKGDKIEYEVPESAAEATASVVRRCIERTNPEAAKRKAERDRQVAELEKRAADEQQRLKDKFGKGL